MRCDVRKYTPYPPMTATDSAGVIDPSNRTPFIIQAVSLCVSSSFAMAFHLVPRINHALDLNPPAGDAHITTHASDWLWAVFAIMLVSWLAALAWGYAVRPLIPPLCFSHAFHRIAGAIGSFTLFLSSCSLYQLSLTFPWHLIWVGPLFAPSLIQTPPVKFGYVLAFAVRLSYSYIPPVCEIYTVVHQRSLGASRASVFYIHGNAPDPHYPLLLLVLGHQRSRWRTRSKFVQVGLLYVWSLWSLLYLVRPGLSAAVPFPRLSDVLRQVSAAWSCFPLPVPKR